ncbi:phosphatase PAP2 family protein [Mariniblastus sp.]|nr:phosphatase PAP2 family protein [Mariniblastus sp.]
MSKIAHLDSTASPRARSDYGVWSLSGYWWQIYLIPLTMALAAYCIAVYDTWLTHPDRLAFVSGDLIRITRLCELFAHGFGVFVVAFGIYSLAPASRALIPRIVASAFWPGMVAHFLKIQFARIRPICYFDAESQVSFPSDVTTTWLGWFHGDKFNTFYSYQSFPSAHTATVFGLAVGLSWAFPRGKYLFISIATLASIQRVVEYAHWPSDVLAGAAVGILCAGALQQNWGLGWLLGRLETRMKTKVVGSPSDQLV